MSDGVREGKSKCGCVRADARHVFLSALKSVDPYALTKSAIRVTKDGQDSISLHLQSRVYKIKRDDRVLVIGAGKAVIPMAHAMEDVLAAHDIAHYGHVVTKTGHYYAEGSESKVACDHVLKSITVTEGGHPVPNMNSVKGTATIVSMVLQHTFATKDAVVISLISGGASALLCMPLLLPAERSDLTPGSVLKTYQSLTKVLLASGLPIDAMNRVRRVVSLVKAGRLGVWATLAQGRTRSVSLILSDVIDDPLAFIASGPTDLLQRECTQCGVACIVGETAACRGELKFLRGAGKNGLWASIPRPAQATIDTVANAHSTQSKSFDACIDGAVRLLECYGITRDLVGADSDRWAQLVRHVVLSSAPDGVTYIRGGEEVKSPSTVTSPSVGNFVVGSNKQFISRAAAECQKLGYTPLVCSYSVEGEASEVACVLTSMAKAVVSSGVPVRPPCALLFGGETTVTLNNLTEDSLGGRNQELASVCALRLHQYVTRNPGIVNNDTTQGCCRGDRIAVLCAGSDGTDGPCDAAGGCVSERTIARYAGRLQLGGSRGDNENLRVMEATQRVRAKLQHHDSYHLLQDLDAGESGCTCEHLLKPGPTGTNVMDLSMILVRGPVNCSQTSKL